MNNFERIKQMTVEEMTMFLVVLEKLCNVDCTNPYETKQWLLSEVKNV